MSKPTAAPAQRLSTGIPGLDEVLEGGWLPNRGYLVRGGPGTGKTTLGVHFLASGCEQEETTLLLTLGEPAEQILANGRKIGLKLDAVNCLDLSPDSDFFTEAEGYSVFASAEVERSPLTERIVETVKSLKPQRVFIDSMTQFRFLSADAFQFRKQVLSFLRFLLEQGATVLFTSEHSPEVPDDDLQFMSDGVLSLRFDDDRRTLRVRKFRGSNFQDGTHAMRLSHEGVKVFPKLIPRIYRREFVPEPIASGIPTLDELLHGGIERGTVTLLSGPSGVGKTTIGIQFMKEAAGRGERSVVYTFEEEVATLLKRSQGINIPMQSMVSQGILSVAKVEPLQYSPEEFASMVREEVEQRDAQIVMIDSVSGYRLSMQGVEDLLGNLHSLCKYLVNMGVTVILISETESLSGDNRATSDGFTYLADNLIVMRYMDREVNGHFELRKSINVMKKRLSDFEKTLRELKITRYGIKVSKPIEGLEGILSTDGIRAEETEG